MGDKVPALIEKYGIAQSMSDSIARYSDKGLYFSLKDNVLFSTWIFVKSNKSFSHQLFKFHSSGRRLCIKYISIQCCLGELKTNSLRGNLRSLQVASAAKGRC